MGLSYLEIRRVLDDLAPLSGALLQEVYQPTPTELVLELRSGRENFLLLFSVHPRLSRVHLVRRRPPNPLKPFLFQMLCRKELSGRLERLEQPGGDRVLRLSFQGTERRTLVAELTDRHGNLFLLDDADVILGSLVGNRPDSRGLAPGRHYVPMAPPSRPGQPHDRFAVPPSGLSFQESIEAWFIREQERLETEDLRGRLRSGLRRELKRLERRRIDLEGDLQKAEKAEQHRRFGDLLQIHLREIPRGKANVVVRDVFQEDEAALVEVPLDPQLDPIGNVQRHYRLYRKYDASIPVVLERIEDADGEMRRLAQLERRVEEAVGLEALRNLEREANLPARPGPAAAARGEAAERRPYLRYLTSNGGEIWVGRTAADNDTLTFRVARGNDFWLHVRGRPGAHVVIPARGTTPDLETLLDAACLTLRHSGLPTGERAEVAYTRAKYVRRIPGAAPGLVTFSQDKTLFVEVSPERLARLTRVE